MSARGLAIGALLALLSGCAPWAGEDLKALGEPVVYQAVSIGGPTCGVGAKGGLWCWGLGGATLGTNGVTESCPIFHDRQNPDWAECSQRPLPVAGHHAWRQVASASTHVCAVTTGDELYCWGGNTSGELGRPPRVDPATGDWRPDGLPTRVEGLPPIAQVAVTVGTTCAVTTAGALWCWGAQGALTAAAGGAWPPTPTLQDGHVAPFPLGGPRRYAKVVLAQAHGCVLTAEGAVECWGQLGYLRGAPCLADVNAPCAGPTPVDFGAALQDVALSDLRTCGLEVGTGDLYCYGYQGTRGLDRSGPFASLALAGGTLCLASPEGLVHCEANGVTTGGEAWPRLHGLAVGQAASCGLDGGGDLWCWGANTGGALGTGSWEGSSVPVRVSNPWRY